MPERHAVSMLMLHAGTQRDAQARDDLAAVLPPGSDVGTPDADATFEVHVEADDVDGALQVVWDAVAASGTDDHLVFLEHPDLPEHWRHRSGRPEVA